MTSDRTMGRVGRSKTGGDSSTELGRQGGARRRVNALGVLLAALACLVAGAALLVKRSGAPAWPPENWAMVVCDVGQGDGMLLSDLIDTLAELLKEAKRANDQGLDARTFQAVMRDRAKAAG